MVINWEISDNGKMYFIWNQRHDGQREAKVIIRNRLTKEPYHEELYSEDRAAWIVQNGLSCGQYGIPLDEPLEVASFLDNGEECGCVGGSADEFGRRYRIRCTHRMSDGRKLLLITMPQKLTEEAVADLPEELLCCEVQTPGNERIRLYLPKLRAGENRFEIKALPAEYSSRWVPKLADDRYKTVFIIL